MKYVLITPARNEESFIEGTIKSVIAQTNLPAQWIIVDDGSTDRTAEIVAKYAQCYSWIELLRRPQRLDRSFAAKAHAFLAGRGYVTPEDVKLAAPDVLRHRLVISFEAEAEDLRPESLVKQVLDKLPVP